MNKSSPRRTRAGAGCGPCSGSGSFGAVHLHTLGFYSCRALQPHFGSPGAPCRAHPRSAVGGPRKSPLESWPSPALQLQPGSSMPVCCSSSRCSPVVCSLLSPGAARESQGAPGVEQTAPVSSLPLLLACLVSPLLQTRVKHQRAA